MHSVYSLYYFWVLSQKCIRVSLIFWDFRNFSFAKLYLSEPVIYTKKVLKIWFPGLIFQIRELIKNNIRKVYIRRTNNRLLIILNVYIDLIRIVCMIISITDRGQSLLVVVTAFIIPWYCSGKIKIKVESNLNQIWITKPFNIHPYFYNLF